MQTIKFIKDYNNFKKGQYLEFPKKRYTGQIYLEIIWQEVYYLIKNKIVKSL